MKKELMVMIKNAEEVLSIKEESTKKTLSDLTKETDVNKFAQLESEYKKLVKENYHLEKGISRLKKALKAFNKVSSGLTK